MEAKSKQWMTVNISVARWEKLDTFAKKYNYKKTDLINDFIDYLEIWLKLMEMAKQDTTTNLTSRVEEAIRNWERKLPPSSQPPATPSQSPVAQSQAPPPNTDFLHSKQLPWEHTS